MKIFDRYIARQLLGVTALGVMALSALLLLGNLFKELRPLLVEMCIRDRSSLPR